MNFFPAQRWGETLTCDVGGTALDVPMGAGHPNRVPDGARVFLGWRPEHLRPTDDESPALPCAVDGVDISLSDAHPASPSGARQPRVLRQDGPAKAGGARAKPCGLHFAPRHAYYFDQNENRL